MFRIGDLFEIRTGSLVSSADLVSGDTPRISAKSDNNGILGYYATEHLAHARHCNNFISVNFFGANGGIFYHPYKASIEMKVHTLQIPDVTLNHKTGNFICTLLKQSLSGFGYGDQLSSSKLKNLGFKIKLPIKDGTIDYEFMERFMAKLEAEHIALLEGYLSDNKSTLLKQTDIEASRGKTVASLNEKLKSVEWGEFEIKELFDISRGNISNQKELVSDPEGIAFIAQHDDNNGFIDRVKLQNHKKFTGNALVVGRQTAVVYFQEHDFITTDGVLVLTPKWDVMRNRYIGIALASSLKKQLTSFGYSNTVSETKLNIIKIKLPINDGKPDYETMETIISAIQKLVIKQVVLYVDAKTKSQ